MTPKDSSNPFVINGIKFKNKKEYDDRIKADALEMAKFLHDVYQEKKLKDRISDSDKSKKAN